MGCGTHVTEQSTADHTHQSNKDADELYNVSVSHRVQSTHQRVENSNTRRNNDRSEAIQADNDTDSGTKSWQDGTRPKYLAQQCEDI